MRFVRTRSQRSEQVRALLALLLCTMIDHSDSLGELDHNFPICSQLIDAQGTFGREYETMIKCSCSDMSCAGFSRRDVVERKTILRSMNGLKLHFDVPNDAIISISSRHKLFTGCLL